MMNWISQNPIPVVLAGATVSGFVPAEIIDYSYTMKDIHLAASSFSAVCLGLLALCKGFVFVMRYFLDKEKWNGKKRVDK